MTTLLLVDYGCTRSENGAAYARREDTKIHVHHFLGKQFPPEAARMRGNDQREWQTSEKQKKAALYPERLLDRI